VCDAGRNSTRWFEGRRVGEVPVPSFRYSFVFFFALLTWHRRAGEGNIVAWETWRKGKTGQDC